MNRYTFGKTVCKRCQSWATREEDKYQDFHCWLPVYAHNRLALPALVIECHPTVSSGQCGVNRVLCVTARLGHSVACVPPIEFFPLGFGGWNCLKLGYSVNQNLTARDETEHSPTS